MTRSAFIDAVASLVREWNVEPAEAMKQLTRIHVEVRNSTAFELATAVEERNKALAALHQEVTRR